MNEKLLNKHHQSQKFSTIVLDQNKVALILKRQKNNQNYLMKDHVSLFLSKIFAAFGIRIAETPSSRFFFNILY